MSSEDKIMEGAICPQDGSVSLSPPGEDYLIIQGLKKIYRRDETETVAIEDFSLNVKKGELIALVGPSGCGKTTILRLIAGLIEPTEGKVLIKERVKMNMGVGTADPQYGGGIERDPLEVEKLCTAPGADRGMVFQDFALFPWRSVRKNVEFGLEVAGVPKAERRERAEKYIKLAGLEKFIDSRIHELSGGMKQRVGIARALVGHPDVILMDEPFGALDAQTRNIMQVQLLNILDKTDQTIIFVTHSVDEAVFLADRIVILTKRPAKIKEIVEVPWTRPRDRACAEFTALRKKILLELENENVMD